MNFQIISDGSCDLPIDIVKENRLEIVPFYVSFDSVVYEKEGVDIQIRDFYNKMVENPKEYPKSSLPSVIDYYDVFVPYVEKNIPIICICITTKFSGSMQSALSAKDLIKEEYEDAEITVIDAKVNTILQGLLVLEAAKYQKNGASYKECIEKINEIKNTGRIFFTVGDMEHLKKGGRIGKLTGLAGSVLGIKPIITLKKGEIFPSGITRSRKKSKSKILALFCEYIKEMGLAIEECSIGVGYGYDIEEAQEFRKYAVEYLNKELKPNKNICIEDIKLDQIGATIGVHTGPYPLGLAVIKRA